MTRLGVAIALWCVFAFVTWNVIYDRLVAVAAVEFTRDQITRHQTGQPVTSIHEGFSPRVREAALEASLWTTPILAAGALSVFLSFRRGR
jgi:hypothetical protein